MVALCIGCGMARAADKIIIDTDIGDDVDDAFAVALALKSPEFQILGISTTFGDAELRAKLVHMESRPKNQAKPGRWDSPEVR